MKKLILGACTCFMGMALFVRADLPIEITDKLTNLSAEVEALVAEAVIPDQDEREIIAQKLEFEIAQVTEKINELTIAGKIEMKDTQKIMQDFAKLWDILSEWKEEERK